MIEIYYFCISHIFLEDEDIKKARKQKARQQLVQKGKS